MDLTDDKVTEMAQGIVSDARTQISNVSCSCGWPDGDGTCAKRLHNLESTPEGSPCKMDLVRAAQEGALS